MLNKFLAILFAVVLFQVVYFLVKSMKDRYRSGNILFLGKEYIRGYIAIALLLVLLLFTLL